MWRRGLKGRQLQEIKDKQKTGEERRRGRRIGVKSECGGEEKWCPDLYLLLLRKSITRKYRKRTGTAWKIGRTRVASSRGAGFFHNLRQKINWGAQEQKEKPAKYSSKGGERRPTYYLIKNKRGRT